MKECEKRLKAQFEQKGLKHSIGDLNTLVKEADAQTIGSPTFDYIQGYILGLKLVAENREKALQYHDSLLRAAEAGGRELVEMDGMDHQTRGLIDAIAVELL